MLPPPPTNGSHLSVAERIRRAAEIDEAEAASEEHAQLRAATYVIKRFTFADRLHVWWYSQMISNPEHNGILLPSEWAALEAICHRQREKQEGEVEVLRRLNAEGRYP